MRTLVVLLLFGTVVSAQQTTNSGEGLDALVREVRALRLAFEHGTGAGLRVQVLAQRLALQDQRLRAASQQAHEIQTKLADIGNASASTSDLMARLDDQLREEPDSTKRRQIADQQAELKLHLESRHRMEQDLRARAIEAEQLVRAEQVKWEELNGKLDDLDRELGARR